MNPDEIKANERSLSEMPPIMSRPAPNPKGGRGPRTKPGRPETGGGLPPRPGLGGRNMMTSPSSSSSVSTSPRNIGNATMYKPGWSIPKMSVEQMADPKPLTNKGLSLPSPSISAPHVPQASSLLKNKKKSSSSSVLDRFDQAVANPSARSALTAVNNLRRQLSKTVKSKGLEDDDNNVELEMDRIREKFMGEISSELGFSYEKPSNSNNSNSNPASPAPHNKSSSSFKAVRFSPVQSETWGDATASSGMSRGLRDWNLDAQKTMNKDWTRGRDTPRLLSKSAIAKNTVKNAISNSNSRTHHKNNSSSLTFREFMDLEEGRSSTRRVGSSEDKLSTISRGFRQALEPISSRDARDLIKTPPENMIKEVATKHFKSLMKNKNKKTNQEKVAKNNLKGLMSLETLYEIQRENQDDDDDGDLEIEDNPKDQDHPIPDSLLLQEFKKLQPSLPSLTTFPGGGETLVKRSLGSIDSAAKIAKDLASIMTKVALQNQGNGDNQGSLGVVAGDRVVKVREAACGPGGPDEVNQLSLENPYTSITTEIKRGADRLANVAGMAERNLKLNRRSGTFGFGLDRDDGYDDHDDLGRFSGTNNPIGFNKKITKSTSTSTQREISSGTSRSRGTEIQTQTETMMGLGPSSSSSSSLLMEKLYERGINNQDFQFVPDMSYTDQLMLKKLRDLKKAHLWDNSKDGEE